MRGPVVLVSQVGAAPGSRAAAAALTCAGSDQDRAGLLIELAEGRAPRPSVVASGAALTLEERLAAHLPDAGVASRGSTCRLKLPPQRGALERIPAALPLARDSIVVVHLPPRLVQPAVGAPMLRPDAALLRADLAEDRALTALAVRELFEAGIRVAVLKRPLGWVASRRALAGMPGPAGAPGLPARLCRRLIGDRPSVFLPGRIAEDCG